MQEISSGLPAVILTTFKNSQNQEEYEYAQLQKHSNNAFQ